MHLPFFFDDMEVTERPKAKSRRTSFDCRSCGLDKGCMSPRMAPYGEGGMRILVFGEAPGEEEDGAGRQFIGRSGQYLRKAFKREGIDLDKDCVVNNIVQCRPPKNRTPTDEEIKCCSDRVERQIRKIKPDLIYAFGTPAIAKILDDAPFGPTATNMHGRVVPSVKRGCWVACSYHPSWFTRGNTEHGGRLSEAIRAGLKKLYKGVWTDRRLDPDNYTILEDYNAVASFLEGLKFSERLTSFDYETTGLNPFDPKSRLLMVGFANSPEHGVCIPLDHPHAKWTRDELAGIYAELAGFLISDCPKTIQNWQFEELWSRVKLGVGVNNVICCTELREHVLDNRQGVTGQAFQEYVRYGETAHKGSVNAADMEHEFIDTIARYCALDCRYQLRWKLDQDAEMNTDLERAYQLFHRATPTMVACKVRGIKVDNKRLDEIDREVQRELDEIRAVQESGHAIEYRRKYGKRWDPNSNRDKQRMFYGMLGMEPLKLTPKGKDKANPDHCSTDAESMEYLAGQAEAGSDAVVLIKACQRQAKITKLGGYVSNFKEQRDADGYLHPSFLLHNVSSYRSSSSDPNFQNFPVRDEEMARLRTCLVPRHDWLMEMDFSGAEVRGYATYSRDRKLVENIRNRVDYHRLYASLLYGKPEDEITSEERYDTKSGFVFPELYGKAYEAIYYTHPEWPIKNVEAAEKKLWGEHPDLRKWQRGMERHYQEHGYLQYLTGFRAIFGKEGFLRWNQICNMPNQGLAFHRLLKCMIDIEDEMRRREMTSIAVGQIHDSVVFDVVNAEAADLYDLCRIIVERPAWEWDTVVGWEAEFKIGRNLLDMKEI